MTQPPEPKTDVLVVDDLPDNLLVYQCVLEELGQNLVMARSGEEALKHLLEREFAVVLLDVNMPGIDGFETAALIRQRKKSARTPIIFLTAFSDELPPSRAYASGAVDYISTPIVPEILRAKVRVFVELYQLRQQTALQAEERVRRKVAEDAARRSAFLAEASGALASSLDFETMVGALTRVGVSFLADVSMLCLNDGTGPAAPLESWKTLWAWAQRESPQPLTASAPLSPSLIDDPPAAAALRQAIEQVLSSGRPGRFEQPFRVRLAQLRDGDRHSEVNERGAAGQSNGQLAGPREMPLTDVYLLPLMVRGRARGALCLGRMPTRCRFTPDDLDLCRELVSRAGMTLENALLVQSIQEADRRKDEFLAMLAHELRNPLAPIRNAVQLMRLGGATEGDLRQARDLIDRQVSHLVRLVDDLLDATRIARGKVPLRQERCDITRIVRQTAEDYRPLFTAAGLSLETDLPNKAIWVHGDPTRLTQVLNNLLNNARKFTDRGGQATVRLASEDSGRTAVLSVRDTGIGIEPQMLSSIFDVFVQADRSLERVRGGLGLGLSLVKGLVGLHDGQVLASSAGLGQGAEFVVRLPTVAPQPEVSSQESGDRNQESGIGNQESGVTNNSASGLLTPDSCSLTPDSGGPKHRVLIVDDNRDAAHTAARLLKLAGHDVRTAYTGATGLEVARTFRPGVILCDIGLPGGMSGYDVARAVRQDAQLASAYLIAVTGYGREEDHREARAAGFALHLTKPVDCEKLYEILAGIKSEGLEAVGDPGTG
jgi:signal transduction histidine kinase/DNA-binding response OmpR family regulator